LLAQRGGGVEAGRERPAVSQLTDVVEGCEARGSPSIWIHEREVRQGHERSDGLTGPLDHDPLPCRGLVDDLAKPASNVERGYGSHRAIIAP
jgi:hypothetical protein